MKIIFYAFIINLILIGNSFAFIKELKAPFTTSGKYPFYIGSSLTLTTLIFEDQIVDPTQAEAIEDKPLGKYSKYGDLMGQVVPNIIYFLYMSTNAAFTGNSQAWNNAYTMFEATFYSGLVTNVLKYTVRERRPNGGQRVSFPSGHTATAFAFASVVGARHPWYVGIMAYSLAGFVAYSRMNDNQHWLHDVLAGATIGTSYGVGISEINGGGSSSYSLIPVITPKIASISFITRF